MNPAYACISKVTRNDPSYFIGDCCIEYWGLDTPEYSDRKKKAELFKKYDFRVVELRDDDMEELDVRLPERLIESFPKGHRFH